MAQEKEKICPVCGKPTGGYTPCPNCGVDPTKRLRFRTVLFLFAISLAFGIGYLSLHVASLGPGDLGPNPISIASIDSWLNYAFVGIQGTVVSGPRVSTDSLSFDINDGSCEDSLRIELYNGSEDAPFGYAMQENMIPAVGDNVYVFGQLRVFLDGSRELRVSNLMDLSKERWYYRRWRSSPIETSIANLVSTWYGSQSLKYKRVTLEGKITGLRPLSSANIYTLEDNSGNTLEMYAHKGLAYLGENQPELKLLQVVRVTAGAGEYANTPQITPSSYSEIEVIDNELPIEVSIENLDNTLIDEFVKVSGKIVFVEMYGETDTLEVESRYLWLDKSDNPRIEIAEDVYEFLPKSTRDQVKRGATVELVGRVFQYAGDLRIELSGPPELTVESFENYTPSSVDNVATIDSSLLDNFVTIRGTMISYENVARVGLPDDREFVLQDNLGENIGVWIPNTVYERMIEPPAIGEKVWVVGKVIQRVGEIQVQPGLPSDVWKVS